MTELLSDDNNIFNFSLYSRQVILLLLDFILQILFKIKSFLLFE
jgi:hypothetical protein